MLSIPSHWETVAFLYEDDVFFELQQSKSIFNRKVITEEFRWFGYRKCAPDDVLWLFAWINAHVAR